jgi:hypothetical protein
MPMARSHEYFEQKLFLQSKLDAKNKEKVYFVFCNSFFFSKLANDDMTHGKFAFE